MSSLLYRTAIRAYGLSIGLASLFSEKAAKWKEGRKGLFQGLEEEKKKYEGERTGWIWIHSSSLGEFEQVRPVLEALREDRPNLGICLSFFSPSGYEARKGKGDADIVTYMPLDVADRAQHFVRVIDPDLAIFVKYELWQEHLKALNDRNVPTFLIAAVFRPGHRYFRWYGGFFRRILQCFHRIHVQEERSKQLLEENGIEGSIVSGDPRYDRVSRIASESEPLSMIEDFKGEQALLIAGSSWPQEEKILRELLQGASKGWKLLLAPHDVSEDHVRAIESLFSEQESVRYSDLPDKESVQRARILIVDRIGLLSRIYEHGDLALVGGGFSGSLHNVLEPAAHGVPVCFGPAVTDFPEAVDLIVHDAAFAITGHKDLEERLGKWSEDPEEADRMGKNAHRFVELRRGASRRILEDIGQFIAPSRNEAQEGPK